MTADQGGWTRDYRALRPRTLAWQFALLIAVEAVLFQRYDAEQARFHWSTHFLDAFAFTSLVSLIWLWATGRPGPRYLLLTLIFFHVYAIVPDLMFSEGSAHSQWQNIFLGHIAEHYLPGGAVAWLAIALVLSGTYITALTLWLRAKSAATANELLGLLQIGT
jgi:hypothetical protein